MNRSDVLFVGGDVQRLASVKIRCAEIAAGLGCDVHFRAMHAAEVPPGYKAYICVKPDFGPQGVAELSRRGRVIWDILDENPPRHSIHTYIASTRHVADLMKEVGSMEVIPHYHCNFEKKVTEKAASYVSYIGSEHWYPHIPDVAHKAYFVDRWSRAQVANVYMDTAISINLRRETDLPEKYAAMNGGVKPSQSAHIRLNSGIKLINCLGYGLPSVSGHEPAYHEIAPDCTLFSDTSTCRENIERLIADPELFKAQRARCLARAQDYCLEAVLSRYARLFERL